METALPPGQNHHAVSEAVAKHTDAVASSATGAQTAPRPAGTVATATVAIPVKTLRTTAA
jgi:hypothetical protein